MLSTCELPRLTIADPFIFVASTSDPRVIVPPACSIPALALSTADLPTLSADPVALITSICD